MLPYQINYSPAVNPNLFSGSAGAMNPTGIQFQQMASPNPSSSAAPITGIGAVPSPVGTPQIGGGATGNGLGWNLDTANLALGGLQTIAGIWNAWKAHNLAEEQFNFQKTITKENLANQVQSYNTSLEDRAKARFHQQNQSPAEAIAYINANKLQSNLV